MQGWLHEKAEQQQEGGTATSAQASSSSGVGGECPVYVRCTRDGGGISAAHLRRHSCSSSIPNAGGSAKKRWLRQAMFESTEEAPDESHLVEGASSELPAEDAMLMSGGGGEDSCHSVSSPPPGGGAGGWRGQSVPLGSWSGRGFFLSGPTNQLREWAALLLFD